MKMHITFNAEGYRLWLLQPDFEMDKGTFITCEIPDDLMEVYHKNIKEYYNIQKVIELIYCGNLEVECT